MQKKCLTPQKGQKFNFPVTGGTAKLSGRDHKFREPTRTVPLCIFRGDEFGKETFWMRTLRNWKMDPSKIYPRRENGKEALTPQRREQFIFPVEKDGTAKLLGRRHEFRETARRLDKPLGVKCSVKNFKANRKSFNLQEQKK